jgi:hypothetical protein
VALLIKHSHNIVVIGDVEREMMQPLAPGHMELRSAAQRQRERTGENGWPDAVSVSLVWIYVDRTHHSLVGGRAFLSVGTQVAQHAQ